MWQLCPQDRTLVSFFSYKDEALKISTPYTNKNFNIWFSQKFTLWLRKNIFLMLIIYCNECRVKFLKPQSLDALKRVHWAKERERELNACSALYGWMTTPALVLCLCMTFSSQYCMIVCVQDCTVVQPYQFKMALV